MIIPFISTFNKNNPEIFPMILENTDTLKSNEKLGELLNSHRIINCKRQAKNLKKILTSARINDHRIQGVRKCNKPRCTLCSIIIEGPSYFFKNSIQFIIRRELTCDSKNTVYVLRCNTCSLSYIGSTGNLRERIAGHKSNINIEKNRILNVSKHLHSCSNGDFKFMPIYQATNYSMLLLKEQLFIERYQPALNKTGNDAQ